MSEENQNLGNANESQELSKDEIINKVKELGFNVLSNEELANTVKEQKDEQGKHFGLRLKSIEDQLIQTLGVEKQQGEKAEDLVARSLEGLKKPVKEENNDAIKALEEKLTILAKEKESLQNGYEQQLKGIELERIAQDALSGLQIDEKFKGAANIVKKAFLERLGEGEITETGLVFKDAEGILKRNERQELITAQDIARDLFKELIKEEPKVQKGVNPGTPEQNISDVVKFSAQTPPTTRGDAEQIARAYLIQKGSTDIHAGSRTVRAEVMKLAEHYKLQG